MAKKQDNKKNIDNLMSQDFLGDLNKIVGGAGSGLFKQLAKYEAQQAIQPLADSAVLQAGLQPIVEKIKQAENIIAESMNAYIAANPELDESQLYDGTSDILENTMKTNSDEYRKLSRQLAFVNPGSEKYEEIVNKMNGINSTSTQLRDDNTKLLNIRNLLKDTDRVNNISGGEDPFLKSMYDDILKGNKERFQSIDGKLHYVMNGQMKAVSEIDAGGPTMENDVAFKGANALLNNVLNMKNLNQQDLAFRINNMYNQEGFGNAGIKSLIFDSENITKDDKGNYLPYSPNGSMFNTTDWWNSFYEKANITTEEDKLAARVQIQKDGVTKTINGVNVRDHFTQWYAGKLTEAHKNNVTSTTTDFPPDPITGDEDKIINYGSSGNTPIEGEDNSPFYKLTTQGASFGSDILDKESLLLSYGDDDFVENRLNEEYGTITYNNKKHNFSFKANRNFLGFGDDITVTYTSPNGKKTSETFRHDHMNLRSERASNKDISASQELRAFMEKMIGYKNPILDPNR